MSDREEASEDKLGGIADTFAKVKEFLEVTGFNFGGTTRALEDSPTRKNLISFMDQLLSESGDEAGTNSTKIISHHQPM